MAVQKEIEYWRKLSREKAERDRIWRLHLAEERQRDRYEKSVLIGQIEFYLKMIPEQGRSSAAGVVLSDPYGHRLEDLERIRSKLWCELQRRTEEEPAEMCSRLLKFLK